jgi:hypothetical protein
MPVLSPRVFPFLSVGVLEIFYMDQGQQVKVIGTGWLFSLPNQNRRDLILGAGHNLVHLGPGFEEAQFTLYGDRDVNSIAVRRDGSRRFAIADSKLPADFGVAVLAETPNAQRRPIALTVVKEGAAVQGTAAGGLAREVERGNRAIYQSAAKIQTEVYNLLYFPRGTTEPGMSGGPILIGNGESATSIGIIHGAGTINQREYDLASAINQKHLESIQDLVRRCLAGA